MSTILSPCLEPQFIETATVKLKFAPPVAAEFGRCTPCFAAADATEQNDKCHQLAMHVGVNAAAKTDLCGLSFQQILSNFGSSSKETVEKETVYVHPMSRRSSSSRLSEKSFEMCTENLGSETGTDIIDSSILSLSSCNNSPREKSSSSPREYSKNKVNSRNFPPPLTTISGANSLQVRPHREDGRLVIKAIETPATHAYLRAERSNGRLRLCLLKEDASRFEAEVTAQESEVESEIYETDAVEKIESYINDEDLEEEDQELEDQSEVDDEDEDDDDDDESDAEMTSLCSKDMDGSNFDIDQVEMGMEKFQRLSRCNQGGHSNKGLYNWEPLWVATS